MARKRQVGGWDHILGLVLCVGYVAVLLVTAQGLGMARDEGFYVRAGEQYAAWIELFLENPAAATERGTIDRFWVVNSEHPPLMKVLFGLSWLVQRDYGIFPSVSSAFRFPGMLSAGLLLWLIYIFGSRAYGRTAGLFAALAFALLPRPFYHAHLNCFDIPIVLMLTWVTYCYYRALTRPRWLWMLGIAYGLALSTKHNSWVLPGIFLMHWLFLKLGTGRAPLLSVLSGLPRLSAGDAQSRGRGRWLGMSQWPRRFVRGGGFLPAMALIGIPLFIASWPWIWPEQWGLSPEAWERTWTRFNAYAAFHFRHDHYNMEYFGRNYFEPPLPMSFPWVMTLFTVPLTVIALSIMGIAMRLSAMVPRRWSWRHLADVSGTDVLFIGSMLAPMVVISMPWTPIFGGTKHWFPGYPFLCLFAGYAVQSLLGHCARAMRDGRGWWRPLSLAVVFATLLAPSALETAHSHRFGLSHYTSAAGYVPGAADHGMNRQFWGFTTGSLTEYFRAEMPDGGTVWICDTRPEAWEMLQRDGLLPSSIRWTPSLPHADFAIVHHEKHFAEVDFQIWEAFGSVQPAHVLTYDGVPIISVYENPRHRGRER